ncbi:MAG: S1/P1 Nuclease [Caulobacteraceae bacterium]
MSHPLSRRLSRLSLACAFTAALAGQAMAWGSTGHRMIGRLAVEALPADLPAFARSADAAAQVGELAREPDRWKGAGKVHDGERDGAHFLDLGDDGKVLGGPALIALPATREAYDTALRAAGADSWKAGWLPYSILDAWQQLAKDFAYWRVDTAAARTVADRAHRAWFALDAAARQGLILRDLGVLGHYVGDASQPLHVSEHFNGWGAFPNPDRYTQDRVHAPFEGMFVRDFVSMAAVRADMTPLADCRCPMDRRVEAYLAATNQAVRPFYALYKAGGFVGGDARGRAFAARRLAAGASELRDETVAAWRASAAGEVGWPSVKVTDVEAGKLDPYDSLFGAD